MAETANSLRSKAQTLRDQAQEMQTKTTKSQEYLNQQQTRHGSLLTERSQYVTANPSVASLVTPSTDVPPEQAKEPSGCIFAGFSGKQRQSSPPANAAAHPRLIQLNEQIAELDNLIGIWKGRLSEYQAMTVKLNTDAATLEQKASELDNAEQETKQQPVYKNVLYRTDIQEPPLGETLDEPFTSDAIHVRRSNQQITGNIIRDTILDTAYGLAQNLPEMAHRDAIQLIPFNQFAGGELENLLITGNRINSEGKLQGIFGSDGIFRNLTITFNTIDTRSDHKITLNGLVGQQNHIEGNRDFRGDLVPVQLNPIRLGGNLATGNVWILSVVAEDQQQYGYGYINVGGDIASGAHPYRHITDNRGVEQNRDQVNGDVNLVNFPMSEYKRLLEAMPLGDLIGGNPVMDSEVAAWLQRVEGLMPGSSNLLSRVEKARAAYQMQRDLPVLDLAQYSPDLQNFCVQALARWVGGMTA